MDHTSLPARPARWRALALATTAALVAGILVGSHDQFSAGPPHPGQVRAPEALRLSQVGARTVAPSPVQESFSLISDSGGTVPAKGDTVTMLFDGSRTVWLLLTSAGGDLSFGGSYSYAGGRMSLSFTASGFTRHGSFPFALGQGRVSLPFQTLSSSPGTSIWSVQPVDAIGAAVAVAVATFASSTTGTTTTALVQAAATDLSAATGAPITESPQFATLAAANRLLGPAPSRSRPALATFVATGPRLRYTLAARFIDGPAGVAPARRRAPAKAELTSFNPLTDGITELPDGLELQSYYGATVTVAFLSDTNAPGATGEQLTPDGTFSNVLNINKSVPSPHNPVSDPPHKTALFFLPFQGTAKNQFLDYSWDSGNNYIKSLGVQKFFDPNIAAESAALVQDGYAAPQVLTGTAANVFALIKALKKNPGVVYYNSHGGPDGSVLTGDFLGNTSVSASDAFVALVAKLAKMGAPKSAFNMGAPPIAGASPTYNAIYLGLTPTFWKWLHQGQGVDLTHSLVYLSACDADQNPALAVSVGARAFFAYDVDVSDKLANAVSLYLMTMLAKKSFTAEEVYYNMLLIDETGHTVYTQDSDFNGAFVTEQRVLAEQAEQNAAEAARKKLGPQPNQPKSDIYNVLDAYGTQSYGDTFPYLSNGWLSDNVDGGAVFYLLVAARAPSTGGTIKQGLKNLKICWNAWWSDGKLPGISSPFCQQAAPGYAPSADEYWYARYLLSGVRHGFSDFYVPRFTLNDGS
jgi:hypothetical protein